MNSLDVNCTVFSPGCVFYVTKVNKEDFITECVCESKGSKMFYK